MNFNGVKKRAKYFVGRSNSGNNWNYVRFATSKDGDCALGLDGRALNGKILRVCSNKSHGSSVQYAIKINGTNFRFSVLPNDRLAVLEEIAND